jgi:glycerophosphoryl diester phosphodiesterase
MPIHLRQTRTAILVIACVVTNILVASTALSSQPLVIAHRGASGYLPEHTLAAAAMAHAMGADYLEPDVVLSKDGIPVVLHDIHLETTTDVEERHPTRKRPDGRWYAIDFTAAEIKTLRVHERVKDDLSGPAYPKRFPTEPRLFDVPTLEEFLILVQGLNKSTGRTAGIYPELKSPAFHQREGQDIAAIVLLLLTRYGYTRETDPVFIQSFDPTVLQRIKRDLRSPLKLIQLIGDNSWNEAEVDYDAMRTAQGLKKVATYAHGIGLWLGHLLPVMSDKVVPNMTLIKSARAAGLKIHPYTARADDVPKSVKDFPSYLDLIFGEMKVDGVFTDMPDQVVRYLHLK